MRRHEKLHPSAFAAELLTLSQCILNMLSFSFDSPQECHGILVRRSERISVTFSWVKTNEACSELSLAFRRCFRCSMFLRPAGKVRKERLGA